MVHTAESIFAGLEAYSPTFSRLELPEAFIRSVMPFRPDGEYEPDTLYIGRVAELPEPLPLSFIGVGPAVVTQEAAARLESNLVILPETVSVSELTSLICARLLSGEGTALLSEELLAALSSANQMQAIADIAYRYLKNPILISDKSWRALAMAPDADIPGDTDWTLFRESGTLSIDVVTSNLKVNLAEILDSSTDAFYWKDDRMEYPRLYCNIRIGKRTAATLSVLEYSHPFTPQDYEYMPLITAAVSAEMQKSATLPYTRGLKYEEFLCDMLDGSITSPVVIEDRIRSLDLSLKACHFLFVVDVSTIDKGHFSLTFIRDYLEKLLSDSKATVYKNYIVMFKSYKRAEQAEEIFSISGLRSFLVEHHARLGMSRCFSELTEMPAAFREAVDALSVESKSEPYCRFDDSILLLIAKLCSDNYDVLKLCYPRLLTLMEYDRAHKTAFTASLYCYFANGRNITKTANALYLHRNTMIYHLKKLEEIMDCDLSDPDTLMHLELSFYLLRYNKLYSPPNAAARQPAQEAAEKSEK